MIELITSFQTDTLIIQRQNRAGKYVDGRFEPAKRITFAINASVQPMTGKEIKYEASTRQTKEMIVLYVYEKLQVQHQNAMQGTDVFHWRGNDYEVFAVEDWTNTDLPHYKCKAMKIDEQGSR